MLLALSAVSNSTTYASTICNSTTYDSAISNSAITTYLPSPSSPRAWKIIVRKTNIVQLLMGSNKQIWCFNGWLAINCVLSQSRICCKVGFVAIYMFLVQICCGQICICAIQIAFCNSVNEIINQFAPPPSCFFYVSSSLKKRALVKSDDHLLMRHGPPEAGAPN